METILSALTVSLGDNVQMASHCRGWQLAGTHVCQRSTFPKRHSARDVMVLELLPVIPWLAGARNNGLFNMIQLGVQCQFDSRPNTLL